MSVINRMLQDLDARAGAQPPATAGPAVAAVAAPVKQRLGPLTALALLGVVLVLAAAAWWLRPAPVKKPTPVTAAAAPAVKTIVLAPVPAAAVPVPVPAAAAVAAVAAPAPPPAPVPIPQTAPKPVVAAVPPKQPAAAAVQAPSSAPVAAVNATTRVDSPYRRAMHYLAEGRNADAAAALEEALRLDPRDSAARETLVGLLMEARRPDQAMAQLQAGLAADPRQTAMAMLLARLQIDHGGDGIDTLQRSLPFVGGDEAGAAYHAFLAGALQRRQRHREAVLQYQAALSLAPDNGVWWMGLGLSLRADGRTADAADAFKRARAVGGLTAELDAFVERQLRQAP